MSAINQYTDLYRQFGRRIDAASSPVLNALRQAALAALDGRRLPAKGDENYEVSDLEALYAPDYGLNIDRVATCQI